MIKKIKIRKFLSLLVLFVILSVCLNSVTLANDGSAPPNHITSFQIAEKVVQHYFDYSHYKIIGVCMWLKCTWHGCFIHPTPELDEYLPDLLISVYNGQGNDPWFEANETFDKAAYEVGNAEVSSYSGQGDLTNGNMPTEDSGRQYASIRTKSADVIGNPMMLFLSHLPFVNLRSDTTPYLPYYQSDLDAVSDRSGIAEALRYETYDPFHHFIGKNVFNHWGYEFPRSMTTNVDNDYKAAVIIGLHAGDIVTNKNFLHVVHSTSNSCGKNCAVANIIEELKDNHEIWQEIYPLDKHIHPGESDDTSGKSLGSEDDQKGRGNYVFLVWRHYQGCVQHSGRLLWSTKKIPPTKKR